MDIFEILLLTPLPGTQVWEEALARGLVSYDMDWSRLDLRANEISGREPVILSKHLSWKRLQELFALFLTEREHMENKYSRTMLYKTLKLLAFNPSRIPHKIFSSSAYATAARLFFKKG